MGTLFRALLLALAIIVSAFIIIELVKQSDKSDYQFCVNAGRDKDVCWEENINDFL